MTNITPEYGDYLVDKFGLNRPPMNPALNTTVVAILDTELIDAGARGLRGRDNTSLFDPVWCPAMWERAQAAMAELRAALASNVIRFDSHDYIDFEMDPNNPPNDAVFVYRPGSRSILVCCRAGAGYDERKYRGPGYFGDMLNHFAAMDNYYRYSSGADGPLVYGADYELRCNVNIAKDCTAYDPDFGGGTTRQLTYIRGQFLIPFRCCRVCEDLAGQLADTNFKVSVMEAQAKLPPGAVVDPGSPVPPRVPPDPPRDDQSATTPATSSPRNRWRAWWARVCSWAYPPVTGPFPPA